MHKAWQTQDVKLDMTRGKPSTEQLDHVSAQFPWDSGYRAADGTDCRNYGGLDGIPEARELFGAILGVPADNVIVGGNSSLSLMYQVITHYLRGLRLESRDSSFVPTFLCPVPGYDRHFAICEDLGINMISVPMDNNGPVMGVVMQHARNPSVVGMWCVPKYSNPSGITYSDDSVRALASMRTGHPNFRLMWDDAYALHHLTDTPDLLLNIHDACNETLNPNRAISFCSTSKMTFAGAGMSAVAMSPSNRKAFLKSLGVQTIGPDKLNQLRHVEYLRDLPTIRTLMARHAAILQPKFEAVYAALAPVADIATWTKPHGGYFISLEVENGCAKRVVELAGEVGVKLTPAGATHPYGKDPDDKFIRIAPSFPSVNDVTTAMDIVALCIRIATQEKHLRK